MKSFKQKLIERIQQEVDDVPLEQSPLPNPYPVWNPFGNTPAEGPWDTSDGPWDNLPPDVINDLILRWAWFIYNATGSWPDWFEPGMDLDLLDETMKERILRYYRKNPFRPGGYFGDPI